MDITHHDIRNMMVSDGFETVLASRSTELRTVKRYYILAVRVYQCHYRERGHYLAWSDTACVTTGRGW